MSIGLSCFIGSRCGECFYYFIPADLKSVSTILKNNVKKWSGKNDAETNGRGLCL